MNKMPKRVCIYPKDIQRITGKSYRQSIRMLSNIKTTLQKEKDHLVTIEEFCQHTGIDREEVSGFIY